MLSAKKAKHFAKRFFFQIYLLQNFFQNRLWKIAGMNGYDSFATVGMIKKSMASFLADESKSQLFQNANHVLGFDRWKMLTHIMPKHGCRAICARSVGRVVLQSGWLRRFAEAPRYNMQSLHGYIVRPRQECGHATHIPAAPAPSRRQPPLPLLQT